MSRSIVARIGSACAGRHLDEPEALRRKRIRQQDRIATDHREDAIDDLRMRMRGRQSEARPIIVTITFEYMLISL